MHKGSYKKISLSILILIFSVTKIIAQQGSIPEYAMGARAYAMGQSALLSFSDAVHVSMNPASIVDAHKLIASVFYSKYNSSTVNSSFGIVCPTGKYGCIGISYFHFKEQGLERTDPNAVPLDKFSFDQNHLLVTYGRNISNKLSAGFNAKFVSQSMADYESPVQNVGFDIGINYAPKFSNPIVKNLSFGIAVDNLIKPALKLDKEREYLPKELKFIIEDQITFSHSTITLVGNLAYFERAFENRSYTLHLGLEYSYKSIFLRTGYRDNFYSLGLGLKVYMLNLNYFYNVH